jgi:hypothetical protein
MGLDMYITGKRYLWSYPEDNPDSLVAKSIAGMFPNIDGKVKEVRAEFAYWRKANAIHDWFVKNVQDNKDECQETYLEKAELESLLAAVNEVLKDTSKAPELLPTASGFFFGSTNYDEWYFRDLKYTKEVISKLVDKWDTDYKGWSFYYQASW